MINLISDTVTKPTKEMLLYMMEAEVGDDVFGEDPSINELEAKMANMFDKESALFCPSGTMCNQIAIRTHTQALDEMICDHTSHVYLYETGGYATNSGIAVQLIEGDNGKITAEQIASVIKPSYDWLPTSKLVVIENSCNKGGGSYYTLDELKPIHDLCKEKGLILHLDGARLFNVLVETSESTHDIGKLFDSISICLSKGLAAPVGSVLIGDRTFIDRARKFRKVMGGGMRQAGYLAAAGIYALDNHIDRLKDDNDRANKLGQVLSQLDYVSSVKPVKTNIVIFDLVSSLSTSTFLEKLADNNIKATAFGPQSIRFVTHQDFTESMLDKVIEALKEM